jgi:signal transduction histidine kinase
MVVDLPAPFGPTNPVTLPGVTVNDTPSSASVDPKLLRRPETSIVASIPVKAGRKPAPRRHRAEPPRCPRCEGPPSSLRGDSKLRCWRDAIAPGSGQNGGVTSRGPAESRTARVRRLLASPRAGAAALVLAAATESVATTSAADRPVPYVLGCLLFALAATVPVAFLDPPAAAVTVTGANLLSLVLLGHLTVAGSLVQLIVLYRLTRLGPRRTVREAEAMALAACFVLAVLLGGRPLSSEATVLTLLLAASAPATAWAGTARRHRTEAALQSTARADIASELLEHTARSERARIARELHDVVAHHISMISVQAEATRLATPGMPDRGADRLRAIGDTARAALADMHQLLGVLREDGDLETADLRPQPGLDQLAELLDQARDASNSATRLIVRGRSLPLEPGIELAAYRIAQEALTNARRHAPGAAVDVELHYCTEGLQLRIRDNGPGPQSENGAMKTAGHGLAGMHERAAAVGGELRTGSALGGGFLVEASLPAKTEAVG